MFPKFRRDAWLVPTFAIAFGFVTAGPALASCAEPLPIDEAISAAQTVFVGTVSELRFGDRVALFDVEDIWKGAPPATVVVSGGPSLSDLEAAQAEGGDMATSVDRVYQAGGTYLVVSYASDGSTLSDNACSATQLFTSDLEAFRPSTAHAPLTPDVAAATDMSVGLSWPELLALALTLAGSGLVVSRRMRRHADSGIAST